MPISNPLTNAMAGVLPPGQAGANAPNQPPPGVPSDAMQTGGGGDTSHAGGSLANLTGDKRIPVHVGALILAGLAVIVLLHLAGFRFVFDVQGGRK